MENNTSTSWLNLFFFFSGVINCYSIKINMKVFIETKETTGQIFIYRCQSDSKTLLTGVGLHWQNNCYRMPVVAADLPLNKLQKFYNNFIIAVANWTDHEQMSFFHHTEYKETCSRQTTKKQRLNALMLLNKNLLWPSQMENVNRNNVKKLKSRWINRQR